MWPLSSFSNNFWKRLSFQLLNLRSLFYFFSLLPILPKMLTTVRLSFTFQQTDLQTFSVIEKKILFSLHCHLRFLLIHYFSSEKSECEEAWKYVEFLKMDVTEPVNTILQVVKGTLKNEANFVLSIRNYFRKLFTMQSWNQVKKVWKRLLRSAWNRWLWWWRLELWILMRELYISQ